MLSQCFFNPLWSISRVYLEERVHDQHLGYILIIVDDFIETSTLAYEIGDYNNFTLIPGMTEKHFGFNTI